mmetsp:Transcript_1428/g.2036  ORF Transcript_1428/g.2036 Transcript_1428/m.2036 type:complete len:101 (+) Transcript_1428:826-1128(+)
MKAKPNTAAPMGPPDHIHHLVFFTSCIDIGRFDTTVSITEARSNANAPTTKDMKAPLQGDLKILESLLLNELCMINNAPATTPTIVNSADAPFEFINCSP